MSFSGGAEGAVPGFSLKKFESQQEVDEKKKIRQEEWEKVRKPDDPEEAPEVLVDNRCLYDKLQEQKQKKDEEFEEKIAFRNQVRRLDADETNFLDFCTEVQHEVEQGRKLEEASIISEMKDAKVVKLTEIKQAEEKKSRPVQQQGKKSQMALLAGAVKRKGSEDTSPSKKARTESTESETKPDSANQEEKDTSEKEESSKNSTPRSAQLARVIGVMPRALPGLTEYHDSSDSASSSSDSEADFTLSGDSADSDSDDD